MIKLCEVPGSYSSLFYMLELCFPLPSSFFSGCFMDHVLFYQLLTWLHQLYCFSVWCDVFFLLVSLCIYFEAMQKIAVNDFPSLSSQLRHVYIDNDGKNGCCLTCGVGWLLCSCTCFSDATGICVLMLSQLCSNLVQSVVQARLQRGFLHSDNLLS